jgi:hypothetical protein
MTGDTTDIDFVIIDVRQDHVAQAKKHRTKRKIANRSGDH